MPARPLICSAATLLLAGMAFAGYARAQLEEPKTCTEVHTYCMRLCTNGTPPPPPDWKCEANRCIGLQECLTTGSYRMGAQFGHHPPRRTNWGPFEKR